MIVMIERDHCKNGCKQLTRCGTQQKFRRIQEGGEGNGSLR